MRNQSINFNSKSSAFSIMEHFTHLCTATFCEKIWGECLKKFNQFKCCSCITIRFARWASDARRCRFYQKKHIFLIHHGGYVLSKIPVFGLRRPKRGLTDFNSLITSNGTIIGTYLFENENGMV